MFYVRVSAFADALVLMLSEGLTDATYRFMFNLNSTIMKKSESIFLFCALICAFGLTIMCAYRAGQLGDWVCKTFTFVFALSTVILGFVWRDSNK